MSQLILPSEKKIDTSLPFLLPELEQTEVEVLLRNNPELAYTFVQKYSKGEVNWTAFTPAERGVLLHGLLDAQLKRPEEISAIKALTDADWLRPPPTPEEFLNDPKYLGEEMSKAIYAPWRKDLIYILDPKNEIHQWILSGGIGTGKTKISIIAQLYKLCVLTCLRNIHAYFGLDSSTTISFGLFSLSLQKAESAISEDFKKLIGQSPYFKNVFPLKKSHTTKRVLNNQSTNSKSQTDYEIVLPQGLSILMGSKVSHALSFAVVSAILDEMNFRGKRTVKTEDDPDSPENLYSQVRYRITSRFERLGYVPGLLCVISSKKTSSDFLEAHIAKLDGRLSQKTGSWVAKNDPHVFISSYSQWDVKPEKYYIDGNKKTFTVFIGSSQNASRILTAEELAEFPKDSPNIIEVPESVRKHFDYDINAALRELAGISSSPQHLLFEDPTKFKKIWDPSRVSPFREDRIFSGLNVNRSLSSYIKTEEFFFDAGFAMIPKHHPDMLRVMHVDLSKSGDATGIAMGGVSAIKEIVGKNLLGQSIVKAYAPEFFIDFAISIQAPQGDQVDYQKIQQFITYLRAMGFRIVYITFDRFQCLSKNTLINTNKGLIPIQNINIGDIVQSRSGPRPVVNKFEFGNRPTLKLTTSDKDVIEGTHKHKIEVCSSWKYKNGLRYPIWSWKKLEDIKIGDIINYIATPVEFNERQDKKLLVSKSECGYTTQSKQNILSNFTPPSAMSKELAEFLGLVWGDGHIGKSHIALTVSDEKAEDAKKIFYNLFGGNFEYYKTPKNTNKPFGEIRFTSQWFINWLNANNFKKPTIPESILQSSRKVQAAFLRGLFACDGSVSKEDGKITFSTKHYELAKQVRILLRTEFGIQSVLIKTNRGYNGDYIKEGTQYIVSLRGERKTYLDNIGFSYSNKQKLLEQFKHIKGRNIYTKIEKIEESFAEVYDLEIEEDHSYVADGFMSHNSVGPMQMLIKDGFRVDNLSVDTSDIPYVMLRDAVVNGNISMYPHPNLEKECLNLVHDYTSARARVDHPRMNPDGTQGKKDIADAVAGVIANAYATLTDLKKHPDTANADIASKIIGGMYNKQRDNALEGYFTEHTSEKSELDKFVNEMNPLNFKLG